LSKFTVVTKLWPGGATLDLGTDETTLTVPPSASFDRHAANFVVSPDGTHNYQFLFWNTGRHVTNKRHVHWDFSAGGWGIWTATKWYGTPGGTGGQAVVDVEPFSIGGDGVITGSGTAIDTAASTIPAGAFPFSGNDHEIGTAGGAVTVAAKNPFASLQFAGWDQLIFGGDDTGEFDVTDAGGSPGSPSFFPVGGGAFHVNQNAGANLLACPDRPYDPEFLTGARTLADASNSLMIDVAEEALDRIESTETPDACDPALVRLARLSREENERIRGMISALWSAHPRLIDQALFR